MQGITDNISDINNVDVGISGYSYGIPWGQEESESRGLVEYVLYTPNSKKVVF